MSRARTLLAVELPMAVELLVAWPLAFARPPLVEAGRGMGSWCWGRSR